MKRSILFLLAAETTFSCLCAQTSKNPFSNLGYKKQIMYTSSKGEFEEFHGNQDVVEIGSVYFNTKTNKVIGYVNAEKEKAEVSTATSAMSVDPLCEKYYWITPYAYCMNNPVKFVDPDGKEVFATNTAARQMILNTLNKADRTYIVFNENGQINKDVLNSANSSSGNLKALSQMVNDTKVFEVAVADRINYKNENGDVITTNLGPITQGDPNDAGVMSPRTGELGWTGVTQTPGSEPEKYNSTDDKVRITVNSGLSEKGQAQTFAHEGYGHGFLFSLGIFHKHKVQNINGKMIETNQPLKQQIKDRIDETEKNQQ